MQYAGIRGTEFLSDESPGSSTQIGVAEEPRFAAWDFGFADRRGKCSELSSD